MQILGPECIKRLVVYGSDQTHHLHKGLKARGYSPAQNIRSIPTTDDSGFALSPVLFRKVAEADVAAGLVPLYLCLTVGTTSTTAIDPLDLIADVASDYNIWIHVDAAYGGSACICPEFRHYLNGIERVDSLSLSPHKWLLSYLDCCCLWVKRPDLLVSALSTNPEYLRNRLSDSSSVVDYQGLENRYWPEIQITTFVASTTYVALQSHIRSDVRMAKMFEGFVNSDPRFEIVAPRRFALVCFRLKPYSLAEPSYTESLNRKLLEWECLYEPYSSRWGVHVEVCGRSHTYRRSTRCGSVEVDQGRS